MRIAHVTPAYHAYTVTHPENQIRPHTRPATAPITFSAAGHETRRDRHRVQIAAHGNVEVCKGWVAGAYPYHVAILHSYDLTAYAHLPRERVRAEAMGGERERKGGRAGAKL